MPKIKNMPTLVNTLCLWKMHKRIRESFADYTMLYWLCHVSTSMKKRMWIIFWELHETFPILNVDGSKPKFEECSFKPTLDKGLGVTKKRGCRKHLLLTQPYSYCKVSNSSHVKHAALQQFDFGVLSSWSSIIGQFRRRCASINLS